MKSIIAMLIYTGTFIGMFMLLSLIGMLWNDSYRAILANHTWFMLYTMFFGWWIAIFPTREYYMANEHYFKKHL